MNSHSGASDVSRLAAFSAWRHHDIAWFDVLVDKPLFVGVMESPGKLNGNIPRVFHFVGGHQPAHEYQGIAPPVQKPGITGNDGF